MSLKLKLMNSAGIVLPLVAVVCAIDMLWGRHVGLAAIVILAVGYVLTGLGITVGFHRLFTHRSFQTSRAVRYVFAVLGEMAIESDVITWVADHRKHHQFSDQQGDPHGDVIEVAVGIHGFEIDRGRQDSLLQREDGEHGFDCASCVEGVPGRALVDEMGVSWALSSPSATFRTRVSALSPACVDVPCALT